MTPAEFKRKWAKYSGKETSAYQEHFNDLCALLGQPSPVSADPTGSESFCFQKRVLKDAELFAFDDGGRVAEEPDQRHVPGAAMRSETRWRVCWHISLHMDWTPRMIRNNPGALVQVREPLETLRSIRLIGQRIEGTLSKESPIPFTVFDRASAC